jgi:hypothetical protein
MKTMKSFRNFALVIAVVGLVSVVQAGGVGRAASTSDSQMKALSLQKAAKADLSGKWDLNVSTDGGPISAKAEFKVASDGSITGTVESAEYGSSKISSGSVSDASFSIKFNISSDGNVIEVSMSGTFDEKSLKGSGSAGDAGFSFTGTRAATQK